MKPVYYFLILILLQNTYGYCQTNTTMGNKIIETSMYGDTKSEKAKAYYITASTAIDAKDYKKAIFNLKKALIEDPEYIEAYDNLGIAFRQLGQLDSAERYYQISMKKYPKGTVAIRNLAVVEELRKNYDKSIAYYKQALANDPKDPETYYGMMREYAMLQKYPEAIENGGKAERYYKEKNSPYIGDCYYMELVIYLMMDNKPMAQKYMELAKGAGMKIDPQISEALK